MNLPHSLLPAACLLACSSLLVAAPPVKKQGFEAYSLVQTRNIFDPERQPGAATVTPSAQPAPSRTDFAALTGIMITPEKTLAFFSGSRPEYGGVLPIGSAIAGARITRITANTVEVERNGKRTLIAVGQTVPLDTASTPTTAPATMDASVSASASSPLPSTATTPSASPGTPASVDRSAIIRRMMEKRQQELQ